MAKRSAGRQKDNVGFVLFDFVGDKGYRTIPQLPERLRKPQGDMTLSHLSHYPLILKLYEAVDGKDYIDVFVTVGMVVMGMGYTQFRAVHVSGNYPYGSVAVRIERLLIVKVNSRAADYTNLAFIQLP
jgi:hypothetical protein